MITLMNGLFGSSSGVYLVFKILYQNGIDLRTLFIAYTMLSILCFVRTVCLMPKMTFPFTIPINYEYGYAEIFANKDVEQTSDCLVKEQEVEKQLVEVDVVSKVGFIGLFILLLE